MSERWFDCEYCIQTHDIPLCERTLDDDGFADECFKEACERTSVDGDVE